VFEHASVQAEFFDGKKNEKIKNGICLERWVEVIITSSISVFLNRRALEPIIPGRERPEETTICYKISLVQLITNLNVILYLSKCHTVYISVLILFMIIP